jgi:hypothetical protein
MFKKNDDKYQWYWIDYGNITNDKYPDSLLDIERKEENPHYKIDMTSDLLCIVQNFCLSSNISNHKTNRIQRQEFIKKIQENDHDIYNKITSYISSINNFNYLFILISKILYPQEYSDYFKIVYDNKEQIIKENILLCIKHSDDKTYDILVQKLLAISRDVKE